jgi:hypothetical protein
MTIVGDGPAPDIPGGFRVAGDQRTADQLARSVPHYVLRFTSGPQCYAHRDLTPLSAISSGTSPRTRKNPSRTRCPVARPPDDLSPVGRHRPGDPARSSPEHVQVEDDINALWCVPARTGSHNPLPCLGGIAPSLPSTVVVALPGRTASRFRHRDRSSPVVDFDRGSRVCLSKRRGYERAAARS